jgi:hypothetical protein
MRWSNIELIGQYALIKYRADLNNMRWLKYMHQPNTSLNAEMSPYYFSLAESTTCWLLPTLGDDLLLLVVGVNLQYLLEGADLRRTSQTLLSPPDLRAKWTE